MSGINKVILVGHLGKDPEVRHLEGGVSVASFPLATSETYNKDGRKIEQTEWHNIVMWRGLADVASKYLQKGKLVYIEGKLRTRSYEDKEGHKRYTTEVVAENFTMLGRKSDFDNGQSSNGDTSNQNYTSNSSGSDQQNRSQTQTVTSGTERGQQADDNRPMNYNVEDDDLPF